MASQKRALARTAPRVVCAPVDGAAQAAEEPFHPGRDVHRPLLRLLQDVVIGVALLPDLRRHAVEALRAVFRARQSHVGDGARDAAVAVIERVDGHEPEMGEPGFQDRIDVGVLR